MVFIAVYKIMMNLENKYLFHSLHKYQNIITI